MLQSFTKEKTKKIILFSIFALAAFLILFHFTDTPQVWVDEGLFTETARALTVHGVIGVQTQPGSYFPMNNFLLSVSYPVIFPVALSLKLFGMGIWQARFTMVIYMFLLVVFFYLFTKRRYGFYNAIVSVLLLLSFSPFYGNGRPVQGEVPGLAFLVLGSWLLLLWEESGFNNRKLAIFSGLAYGFGASVKPIFLMGIPFALLLSFVLSRKKIENKKMLFIFGLGYLLPVLLWVSIHLPTIHEILNFVPNVLYFASNHGSSIPLSETVITNSLRFFKESTPVLFLAVLVTIILSFVFRFYKKEDNKFSISEYVVLSFIIFNWIGYIFGTGWYRYFFPAHTLLYVLFSAAALSLTDFFHNKFLRRMVALIPILLILFQFIHLVFWSDTNFVTTRHRNPDLAAVFSTVNPNDKVLFYGGAEANIFFKGENYYQYLSMGGFLDTGNKNILHAGSFDDIFSGGDLQISNPEVVSVKCWTKKPVSKYFLFEKIKGCK